jgi:dihydrofolate reductase
MFLWKIWDLVELAKVISSAGFSQTSQLVLGGKTYDWIGYTRGEPREARNTKVIQQVQGKLSQRGQKQKKKKLGF